MNLRFAETPPVAEARDEPLLSGLFQPGKEDIFRLLELGVIALLTLIVLLVVVRPMVRKAVGADSRGGKAAGGSSATLEDEAPTIPMLPPNNVTAQMMEVAKINGQIRADSVDQIGNMVKANPQETVAVLRNWIHDR